VTSTADADLTRPRVVIGVDDSPGARAALAWGLPEAARRGARVQVVTSFPVDYYWAGSYAAGAFPFEEIRQDTARSARRLLGEVTAELVAAGVTGIEELPVEVLAVAGSPAIELVERSRGAALLVVGSRGRTAMRSLLLGSVSLHCAGHAHSPFVVVPTPVAPAPPAARRRVVVGVDGSSPSAAALLAAIAAAGRIDAVVDVVVAFDDGLASTSSVVAPPPAADLQRRAEAGADRVLVEVRAAAAEADLPEVPVQLHVLAEQPGQALVARAAGAALLVVGSHGTGQLMGMVLGSVALHCALHAPCPVLLQREGDRPGVGSAPHAHLAATVPA
jgi:nucleotide-binding universal stress UspA family protein